VRRERWKLWGLKAWRAFTFISFALGIAYLALQYFHTRQNGRYQQVHDLNRFGSNVINAVFDTRNGTTYVFIQKHDDKPNEWFALRKNGVEQLEENQNESGESN